jgi:hypothetical protein
MDETMDCREFEELYWLKAYGENLAGGDDGFAEHLQNCPSCRQKTEEWDRVRALLAVRAPEAAKPEALQAARRRLLARLPHAGEYAPKHVPAGVRIKQWLAGLGQIRAPRWEIGLAVGAVAAGLLLGRLMFHPASPLNTSKFGDQSKIQPASYLESPELDKNQLLEQVLTGNSHITDLRIKPSADQGGLVDVSFKAEKEFTVQGKPNDRLILDLLGWAVKNEQNSGVRLQSVSELAQASKLDARARQVLAYALVNDHNDGVRLKALEALANAAPDQLVEDAILNALLKDPNPAVRIRAIDVLLAGGTAFKSSPALLAAAQGDSNDYVRMQAHRAIRETHDDYRMLDGKTQSPSGVTMQEVGKGRSK